MGLTHYKIQYRFVYHSGSLTTSVVGLFVMFVRILIKDATYILQYGFLSKPW